MRTTSALFWALLISIALTPSQARSQELPSGCRNNDSSRCTQSLSPNSTIEGLIDGRGNRANYFVVDIQRPGLYNLLTTRDRHPRGTTASIKIDLVDGEGYSILSTWLNGSRLENNDLIEISVPGRYVLSMNYNTGNLPVRFTVTLRPRLEN